MERRVLFIVGMPRSGTKLLRDLLSRHSDVAIFPNESHVFPHFAKIFRSFGNISDPERFRRFYREFSATNFFRRMGAKGINISFEAWFSQLAGNEYKDALDALFGSYAELTGKKIVGDKTPDYIRQIPFLADHYPGAKYIHIYRDPRDYVLSINKAWGKNKIRALQRWKRDIRQFQRDVAMTGVSHFSLSYESLLSDGRNVLNRLCRFIGVEFEEEMLTLASPSENIGDAKGWTVILSNNFDKWKTLMPEREVRLIESIAGELMGELGYEVRFEAGDLGTGRLKMGLYKILDGFNLFRFYINEANGILPALQMIRPAKGRNFYNKL